MIGTYVVTSTERLVCRLEVEATSRKDALRKADAVLTHGRYEWKSHGITMKVKKAEGPDDMGRT